MSHTMQRINHNRVKRHDGRCVQYYLVLSTTMSSKAFFIIDIINAPAFAFGAHGACVTAKNHCSIMSIFSRLHCAIDWPCRVPTIKPMGHTKVLSVPICHLMYVAMFMIAQHFYAIHDVL